MVYPTTGCGRCRACRDGRINNCPRIRVFGLSDPRGCFSEEFVVPEAQCVPVSEAVLDRFGALVEPLAVGVHVVRRGGTSEGDTALVVGTGAIGLATTLVARSRGVRVLGADRYPEREQPARACGTSDFTTESGDAPRRLGARASGVDRPRLRHGLHRGILSAGVAGPRSRRPLRGDRIRETRTRTDPRLQRALCARTVRRGLQELCPAGLRRGSRTAGIGAGRRVAAAHRDVRSGRVRPRGGGTGNERKPARQGAADVAETARHPRVVAQGVIEGHLRDTL